MSDDTTPDDPACRSSWRLLGRASVYAGRILVAGIVVVFVLWSVAGLSFVTSTSRPGLPDKNGPAAVSDPALPPLPPQLPGGAWSIAGLPWNLATRKLPQAEAEALLAQPPSALSAAALLAQPPSALSAAALTAPSTLESELIPVIKALGGQHAQEGSQHRYRVPFAGGQAMIFTRDHAGAERFVFARAIYPAQAGDFFVLDVSPKKLEASGLERRPPRVMILPAGAELLATRADENGAVLAELVLVPADPATLAQLWKSAGFRCDPVSGPRQNMHGFTCHKDGVVSHVWLWPHGAGNAKGTDKTLLLQFRLPAEVDR